MTKLPRTLSLLSLFSLLAVLVLAAVTASAAKPKEQPFQTWKAFRAAPLQSAPSSQSPVIASIPKNAVLTSFQPCTRGWCAVEYKGIRGWIYDIFIVEHSANPVAHVPPGPPRLTKAALQRPSATPAPVAAASLRISYRVIGLGAEESLPIREAPLDTAPLMGALSPAANAIAGLETCRRQWCLIEHDGVRGYVRSRFLARAGDAPSPKYGVDGESNMKVFSYGAPDADVVGEIPFYAGGIVPVGDCNGEWCHVRYLGLVGFVDTRRLRPQTSPQG
ncbi:MAG TPA: SH3 domain-containing protein [Geobacterales bacterium]|nr:SH3 domain-containing protein [Geobacterales bacterium]